MNNVKSAEEDLYSHAAKLAANGSHRDGVWVLLKPPVLSFAGVVLLCVGVLTLAGLVSAPMMVHADFRHFYNGEAPYPPLALVLFAKARLLPLRTAYLVWSALSLAAYIGVVFVVLRALRLSLGSHWLLLLLGILLCWYPLQVHIVGGQVSILLAMLMILGWVSLDRGADAAGGILWGIAFALKLFPGLLCVYLLVRKRWRALMSMAVAATLAFCLSLAWSQEMSLAANLRLVLSNGKEFLTYPINVSLHGAVSRAFLPNPWFYPLIHSPVLALVFRLILSTAISALLIIMLVNLPRSRLGDALAFSYCCIAMLLLSPISWQHAFPLLLFPLGLLLRHLISGSSTLYRTASLLVFLGLSLPDIEIARWIRGASTHPLPWFASLPLLVPTASMLVLWGLLARVSDAWSSPTRGREV